MPESLNYLKGREPLLDERISACQADDTGWRPADYAVTAIVSTYRAGACMERCLSDLAAQSLGNRLEIVIVDAASPEGERDIVRRFQESRGAIRYLRAPERISIYAAWNLAIRRASGRHILPFSTNDRLHPEACRALAGHLDRHPGVALVYGDTLLTDDPADGFDDILAKPAFDMFKWPEYSYEDLLATNRVGPHPMWRRSVHAGIGWFHERYTAMADQEFWLRLGRRFSLEHLPVVTGIYLREPRSLSSRPEAGQEAVRIRRQYRALAERDRQALAAVAARAKVLAAAGRTAEALELARGEARPYAYLREHALLLAELGA